MNVKPVAAPTGHQAVTRQSDGKEARARAVEAFNKASTAQAPSAHSPQINQNAISPEDMSAIQPQVPAPSEQLNQVVDTPTPAALETPAETTQPTEDPTLSRQFQQIARQERAARARIQQREDALKAKEAEIQAKEDAWRAKESDYQSNYVSKQRLKEETLLALEEAGITYDQVTEQMLQVPNRDPRVEATINQLKAEIRELKDISTKTQEKYADSQTQAYQAAVKQIRSDVDSLVTVDPNFEMIKMTKSNRDVVELIEETYKKDGILLSVEDAAQQVEDYLMEEAQKLTNIPKLKKLNQSPAPKTQPTAAQQTQPTKIKTLTNQVSNSRQLSARERAILAFKGELKS